MNNRSIEIIDRNGEHYIFKNVEIELMEKHGILVIRESPRKLRTFILRNLISYTVETTSEEELADRMEIAIGKEQLETIRRLKKRL